MRTHPAPALMDQADLEERVVRFEAAWFAGQTPNLADFLPAESSASRLQVLCELLIVDRQLRDRQQLPPPDYATLFPNESNTPEFQAALAHQEPPNVQLGRYEIGPLLGRGSFGKVYRGWDPQLRRLVAVKIPRLGGLLSPQETERFVREAQCAAGLQHPNIVMLYDLGQDEETPYLVYEYVPGESLAARLTQQHFTPRQAAELLSTLADAVAYAHQQGIIHRDLKPANVLLSPDDSQTVKISDFGLARRLDDHLTLTETGQILGTPAYMAPEQAKASRTSDARTDVYSLGVILYELLTGEVPFRGEPVMVLRQISEDDPTPPRRLNSAVPFDLNTICLKCLHKEPALRYSAAAHLADDLRRWLAGKPISAQPLGRWGHFTRWVKREPRLAALVGSLFVVLSSGLTAVLILYVHAREQTKQAEQSRREADAHFRDALAVVDEYLTTVAGSKLLDRPGLQPLRKELVEAALVRYRQFLEQRGDDPKIRAEVGRGWHRVGHLTFVIGPERDALPAFEQARLIQEQLVRDEPNDENKADLAATYYLLGNIAWRFGDSARALHWFEQAIALQEIICQAPNSDPTFQIEYAATLRAIGRVHVDYGDPRTGVKWLARADEILAPLGSTLDVAGVRTIIHHERMQSLRAVGDIRQALAALDQASTILRSATTGQLKRSRRMVSFHLTDFERERWLGNIDNAYGLLYVGTGDYAQARVAFESAVTRRKKLVLESPTVPSYQTEWATATMNLSLAEELLGHDEEAVTQRQLAAAKFRELVLANPELRHLRDTVAYVHRQLADTFIRQQRAADAVEVLRQLRELWAKVPNKGPLERLSSAEADGRTAALLEQLGKPNPILANEAITQFTELRATLAEQLTKRRMELERQPKAGTVRHSLSLALEQAATTEYWLGRPQQALSLTKERLALWDANPREQARAATTLIRYANAAMEPTTLAFTALEAAIDAGFQDYGLLQLERLRYPIIDTPQYRQQMQRLLEKNKDFKKS
jgi:tetratricopeptide (TPR) repeat protein